MIVSVFREFPIGSKLAVTSQMAARTYRIGSSGTGFRLFLGVHSN
jgi:hypothetical protein